MPPVLRFRVTPEIIRVELDGVEVLEDEPVIALTYDARAEDIVVLEWGRRVATLPERLPELDLLDVRNRRMCIVPEDKAVWYDAARGVGVVSTRPFDDPWEHHGEVVIVRPFAPGQGSVRMWATMLSVIRAELRERLTPKRTRWLGTFARYDIALPEQPQTAADHDRLVRSLWQVLGWRIWFDGVPATVHRRTPLRFVDCIPALVCLLPVLPVSAVRASKGMPLIAPSMAVFCFVFGAAACSWLAASYYRNVREPEVNEATKPELALHERAVAGPDVDPRDYEGAERHRFNANANSLASIAPFLLGSPFTLLAFYLVKRGLLPTFALGAMTIVFLALGPLGDWLAQLRLTLGVRGLTLRPSGMYGRPLHIPYTRIRQVSARNDGVACTLLLRFYDGSEISLGRPERGLRMKTKLKEMLAIESAITARLSQSSTYRS